jgi:hypothetical protein
MTNKGLKMGYVSDLTIYAFIRRIYPSLDMNKPSRQLRAIYYNTINRIIKRGII